MFGLWRSIFDAPTTMTPRGRALTTQNLTTPAFGHRKSGTLKPPPDRLSAIATTPHLLSTLYPASHMRVPSHSWRILVLERGMAEVSPSASQLPFARCSSLCVAVEHLFHRLEIVCPGIHHDATRREATSNTQTQRTRKSIPLLEFYAQVSLLKMSPHPF
jgi:hypothetical protein